MKAAIIGAGFVGKAVFHDLQRVNMISEIVLTGRNMDKIKAEVMDARDAAVVREQYGPTLNYGGYEDLAGADIIIYAALLTEAIKKEAFRIFQGKGYTSTGVSAAACRIAAAIAADSREVFPVSSVLQGEYGVNGVAISVPSVLGKNGIEEIKEFTMTDSEKEAFFASVDKMRQAAGSVGIL